MHEMDKRTKGMTKRKNSVGGGKVGRGIRRKKRLIKC